jgi:hypothetical protein
MQPEPAHSADDLYLVLSRPLNAEQPSAPTFSRETKKTGIIETTDVEAVAMLLKAFGP